MAKARRRGRVQRILEEFRGLKDIAKVKQDYKKQYIVNIKDPAGNLQTQRQEIADAFADFYEELFKRRAVEGTGPRATANDDKVSPITAEEIKLLLRKMSRRKAGDADGIVADLLKDAGATLLEILAELFTEILQPGARVPEYWKKTRLKLLFKKGDTQLPDNYRPIAMIPIMYKLWSKVLCSRIRAILDSEQSCDQAGFRSGFSCDDHLFAAVILQEKLNEFNLPLWAAAVDFKKAFDTIEHDNLWQALNNQNVPAAYIDALKKLYEGQSGQVQTDSISKCFAVERGTKQGDPVSPILFNAALEDCMRRAKLKWAAKKWGINVGTGDLLTNLRFADDLLIVGRSLFQVKSMLEDLATEAKKAGLEIHMGKTKIMKNGIGKSQQVEGVLVHGQRVEVLDKSTSTMYLGRSLNFTDTHGAELKHRISRAWAKFGVYRRELLDKRVSLYHRLRLFQAVVTPTVLYGSGTWTMTTARDNELRTVQRKMLRAMLGKGRKQVAPCSLDGVVTEPMEASSTNSYSMDVAEASMGDEEVTESWVEWKKRVTREALMAMERAGVPDWVEEQRRRTWRWGGHVARRTDGRWATKLLSWEPVGKRSRGHPKKRWEDDVCGFAATVLGDTAHRESWIELASCREAWGMLEEDFVRWR
jgi:hypothetical protein